jgi:hypothetical protein
MSGSISAEGPVHRRGSVRAGRVVAGYHDVWTGPRPRSRAAADLQRRVARHRTSPVAAQARDGVPTRTLLPSSAHGTIGRPDRDGHHHQPVRSLPAGGEATPGDGGQHHHSFCAGRVRWRNGILPSCGRSRCTRPAPSAVGIACRTLGRIRRNCRGRRTATGPVVESEAVEARRSQQQAFSTPGT